MSGRLAIAMGSSSSSRLRRLVFLAAVLTAGSVIAGAGCSGRGRGAPRPDGVTRGAAGESGRTEPGAVKGTGIPVPETGDRGRSEGTIVLPGQNRLLPSQDPRNLSGSAELAPPGEPAPDEPTAPASQRETPESASTQAAPPPAGSAPVRRSETPPSGTGGAPGTASQAPSSFLPPQIPPGEGRFRVQVLASAIPVNAYRVRGELEETLGQPVFVEQEQGILKVRAGDFKDRADADTLRRRLFGLGYGDAFVVECRGR